VGYDPVRAPKQSEIIENAWAEHFEQFPNLTRTDLLAAVTEYYRTPGQPWPQPAAISSIAVLLAGSRAAIEGAPERDNLDAIQSLCREALGDAKSGDEQALAWLVREFDYYGRSAVLWATKRKIDWRNTSLVMSGGPVHGDRAGVGAQNSGGWQNTRRVRTPDFMIPERHRDAVNKELRKLLTEDERWQVLGDPA